MRSFALRKRAAPPDPKLIPPVQSALAGICGARARARVLGRGHEADSSDQDGQGSPGSAQPRTRHDAGLELDRQLHLAENRILSVAALHRARLDAVGSTAPLLASKQVLVRLIHANRIPAHHLALKHHVIESGEALVETARRRRWALEGRGALLVGGVRPNVADERIGNQLQALCVRLVGDGPAKSSHCSGGGSGHCASHEASTMSCAVWQKSSGRPGRGG